MFLTDAKQKNRLFSSKGFQINNQLSLNEISQINYLTQQGRTKAARQLANHCWFKKPWDIDLVIAISEMYSKNGENKRAITLLIEARKMISNWRLQRCYTGLMSKYGYISSYLRDQLEICIRIAPNDIYLPYVDLISYVWRVDGCGQYLVDLCLKLERFKKLRPSDYIMIAAIYNEAGNFARAINTYKKAKQLDEHISQNLQYLNLGITLSKRGVFPAEEANLYLSANSKLSDDHDSFEKLVLENKNCIAVVGNSPVLINSDAGEEIDSHNLVIRFNAYSTDFIYACDYGKKTNIWVKTGHYLDIPHRNLNNFDCVVLSGCNFPNRSTLGLDLVSDHITSSSAINFIPNNVYEDLFKELEAVPSAGLCILYWIYTLIGPLPRECFFGFSHETSMFNFEQHYFSNTKKEGSSSHNWSKEAEVIHKYLR